MSPHEPLSLADLTALGQHFAEHQARLLAMLRRRIDPALAARLDAEDVLNQAFLAARRRWAKFRQGKMSAYAWLYRLAQDALIEAWRREKRGGRDVARERPWPERSSAQLGMGLVGSDTGPSTAAARLEMRGRMRQALEMLGPRDQEVLWMRAADGLSFQEVADVLGVTENAATVRYSRALGRLRQAWMSLYRERGPG